MRMNGAGAMWSSSRRVFRRGSAGDPAGIAVATAAVGNAGGVRSLSRGERDLIPCCGRYAAFIWSRSGGHCGRNGGCRECWRGQIPFAWRKGSDGYGQYAAFIWSRSGGHCSCNGGCWECWWGQSPFAWRKESDPGACGRYAAFIWSRSGGHCGQRRLSGYWWGQIPFASRKGSDVSAQPACVPWSARS